MRIKVMEAWRSPMLIARELLDPARSVPTPVIQLEGDEVTIAVSNGRATYVVSRKRKHYVEATLVEGYRIVDPS